MDNKERQEYMRVYMQAWRKEHPGYEPNEDASIRKVCTKCRVEMPATAVFFELEKTRPLGISSQCRGCKSARSAEWNAAHREHVTKRNAEWRRKNTEHCVRRERQRSLSKYDLTVEEYDVIFNAQGGVCAICKAPPRADKQGKLAVDHCHKTTRNRGLLCIRCNQSIERLENDPDWGTKALNYLARYIEQTVKV